MGCRPSIAVAPLPHRLPGIDWLEVRTGVWVRVRHLKPHQKADQKAVSLRRRLNENHLTPDGDAGIGNHPREASVHETMKTDFDNNNKSFDTDSRSPTGLAEGETSSSHAQPIRLPTFRHSSPSREDVIIFFLHGVGGSSDVWLGQLNYFTELGYEVVAPDMIGHGLSAAPRDRSSYEFVNMAADVVLIFEKYKKSYNVVVGHSYGTSFATFVAYHKAKDVAKLVLMSAGPPLPLAPATGLMSMPVCVLQCFKPLIERTFSKKAFYKTAKDIQHAYELAFHVPAYVFRHVMLGQIWKEGGLALHQAIRTPTLIIFGENDNFGTLEEALEMHEAMPRSRLAVVACSSHMVMMEQATEVNRLIETFICGA